MRKEIKTVIEENQTLLVRNEALEARVKTLEEALAENNEDFYFQVIFRFREQLCACPPRKKILEAEEDRRKAIALLELDHVACASCYANVKLIRKMEL